MVSNGLMSVARVRQRAVASIPLLSNDSSNDHDSNTVSPSGFVIEGRILAEVPSDSGTVAPSPLLGLLQKILDN